MGSSWHGLQHSPAATQLHQRCSMRRMVGSTPQQHQRYQHCSMQHMRAPTVWQPVCHPQLVVILHAQLRQALPILQQSVAAVQPLLLRWLQGCVCDCMVSVGGSVGVCIVPLGLRAAVARTCTLHQCPAHSVTA